MKRLAVAIGKDGAGAIVALADAPITIGRAKGSDLVVPDASVSRKHLEAKREAGTVEVRTVGAAMPFLFRGKPTNLARLAPGDHLVVGSTVISVVDASSDAGDAAETPVPSRADVATMIEGLAAEVRGFAAVVRLVEAVEAADDRAALDAALSAWAERGGFATSMTLVDAAAPSRDGELLTSRGRTLTMQVPGHAVAMKLEARGRIDDALRGIVLVGSRIVAARLSEMHARAVLREDVRALRAISIGSAREFLGTSPAAREVARIVPKLAASDATALLLGESGTGKTFVARLVHEGSARKDEPLRVVNCAAIPESLLESELFGAERGAFSGAVATRIGAFEAAGRGTLLLDEIGELPLTSQAKLLRALEDKRFERVGSNRAIPLEARVIAATNRDLAAMVKAGTFRGDLYFRIGVVSVRIPSLRDRGEDVVLLAERLLADLASTAGRRVTGFTKAAIDVIRRYEWPGNVRELRNAIEHALVLGEGALVDAGDLPEAARGMSAASEDEGGKDVVRLPADLATLEARAIDAALRATGGNRTRAAALLGINRVTLQKKLRRE